VRSLRLIVVAALLVAVPSTARAQSFEHPTVLSDTTAQIAPRLQDGELQLGILDRAGEGTWHDPSRTLMSIGLETQFEVPDDPAFAFLGAPGTAIFRTTGAPQPRPAGVLRLGVNTTGVPGAEVTLTLRNEDAQDFDSDVFMYEDDAEGKPVAQWFNSADGLPDAKVLPAGTDLNLGAAFRGGGPVCLDVEAAATLPSGETVRDREWLTIAVGDDPATIRPCGAPGGVHVFDSRHLDLAPQIRPDGTVKIQVHGTGLTDVDDAVFHARPATQLTLPETSEGVSLRFLGAPGDTIWNLPEVLEDRTQQLWAGFNLHGAPDAALARRLSWRLDGVEGPGDVILWNSDAPQGVAPFFSTRIGLPDSLELPSEIFGHFHFNWTFTRQGVYCLNFAVDGRSPAGARLTDSQVLTVAVGDVDPSTVTPCGRRGTSPPIATRPAVPEAPSGGTPFVADGGHYELSPEVRDGALRVPVHELDRFGERPGIDRDLDDVIFSTRQVSDAVQDDRPWLGRVDRLLYEMSFDAFAREGVVLGWSTTRIAPERLRGDLRWRLTSVDGPGTVAIDDFGQPWTERAVLGTVPGYEQSGWDLWPGFRTREPLWGFSKPGVYCVGMEWSGTLASGEPVSARKAVTIVADVAAQRFDPDTGQVVKIPATIDPRAVTPCGRGGNASPPPADAPPQGQAPGAEPPRTGGRAAPRRIRVTLRRGRLTRAGSIRVACRLDAAGRCAIRAWVTARDAHRLRLPRRTLGRGAATLARPGRKTVTVRLSRRTRRALRRSRRAVRIHLAATATAAGRPTATRSAAFTLRR
jgi:surface-anchored protein